MTEIYVLLCAALGFVAFGLLGRHMRSCDDCETTCGGCAPGPKGSKESDHA